MILKQVTTNAEFQSDLSAAEATQYHVSKEALRVLMKHMRTLYANPQWAVIREYLSNALDANKQEPVLVELPGILSQTLRIRDFGAGLSDEQMCQYLLGYGESSKNKANEDIGGFGYGCKCAAAIADTFTFTSYHNGRKIVRVSTINDMDDLVSYKVEDIEDTSPSGLLVEIPFSKYEEATRFTELLLETLPAGRLRRALGDLRVSYASEPFDYAHQRGPNQAQPVASLEPEAGVRVEMYTDTNALPRVREQYKNACLVMGGIPHALSVLELSKLEKCKLIRSLVDINALLVITVPIGYVSLQPSREEIHYNADNLQMLQRVLVQTKQALAETVNAEFTQALAAKDEYALAHNLHHRLHIHPLLGDALLPTDPDWERIAKELGICCVECNNSYGRATAIDINNYSKAAAYWIATKTQINNSTTWIPIPRVRLGDVRVEVVRTILFRNTGDDTSDAKGPLRILRARRVYENKGRWAYLHIDDAVCDTNKMQNGLLQQTYPLSADANIRHMIVFTNTNKEQATWQNIMAYWEAYNKITKLSAEDKTKAQKAYVSDPAAFTCMIKDIPTCVVALDYISKLHPVVCAESKEELQKQIQTYTPASTEGEIHFVDARTVPEYNTYETAIGLELEKYARQAKEREEERQAKLAEKRALRKQKRTESTEGTKDYYIYKNKLGTYTTPVRLRQCDLEGGSGEGMILYPLASHGAIKNALIPPPGKNAEDMYTQMQKQGYAFTKAAMAKVHTNYCVKLADWDVVRAKLPLAKPYWEVFRMEDVTDKKALQIALAIQAARTERLFSLETNEPDPLWDAILTGFNSTYTNIQNNGGKISAGATRIRNVSLLLSNWRIAVQMDILYNRHSLYSLQNSKTYNTNEWVRDTLNKVARAGILHKAAVDTWKNKPTAAEALAPLKTLLSREMTRNPIMFCAIPSWITGRAADVCLSTEHSDWCVPALLELAKKKGMQQLKDYVDKYEISLSSVAGGKVETKKLVRAIEIAASTYALSQLYK